MTPKSAILAALVGLMASSAALAQDKPEDTEVWSPIPAKVTPAAIVGGAPSDAIVLFDGDDLDQWVSAKDKSPAGWTVEGGVVTVNKARGNIETKRAFQDYQLHLEWRIPADITGAGRRRGNSGVFLASTGPRDEGYEVQIVDSYENATYVNGQAASVYKQHPPLANASRKPGEWQTYDIVWRAPSVWRGGRAVVAGHGDRDAQRGAGAGQRGSGRRDGLYRQAEVPAHGATPIKLQAHGDPSAPISFRNIWVRELRCVASLAAGPCSTARPGGGAG
jgi:hypothetical protein